MENSCCLFLVLIDWKFKRLYRVSVIKNFFIKSQVDILGNLHHLHLELIELAKPLNMLRNPRHQTSGFSFFNCKAPSYRIKEGIPSCCRDIPKRKKLLLFGNSLLKICTKETFLYMTKKQSQSKQVFTCTTLSD